MLSPNSNLRAVYLLAEAFMGAEPRMTRSTAVQSAKVSLGMKSSESSVHSLIV
jgi:hypothetical protein